MQKECIDYKKCARSRSMSIGVAHKADCIESIADFSLWSLNEVYKCSYVGFHFTDYAMSISTTNSS